VYILGLFTVPHGRTRIFLYDLDPEVRARHFKMENAFDIAREKCKHLDMTEAGDECWNTAYNEFMAK
jgi:hypothetical protein